MAAVSQHDECNMAFAGIPPFPSDVRTAPLLRISLKKLVEGDAEEELRLWRACCDLGFFYLDLRSGVGSLQSGAVDGDGLLGNADDLFHFAEQLFSLPEEEKQRYDFAGEGSYFGYKGLGKIVIEAKGYKDRYELWNVSKDDIFGLSPPLPNPEVLRSTGTRGLIKQYMARSHAIILLILDRLNIKLGLPAGTLQNLHRMQAHSGDQLRWVRSPPQPMNDRKAALGEHTDYGSVTILFNRLGGLQVLLPDQDTWSYVQPLQGHCVVNLGDAMVKFTAGVLRSNVHRVVNPPGLQESETRLSLVYFSRPEDEVLLMPLHGSELIDRKREESSDSVTEEKVTAKEWTLRRALAGRTGAKYRTGAGTEANKFEKRDSGIETS